MVAYEIISEEYNSLVTIAAAKIRQRYHDIMGEGQVIVILGTANP